MLKCSLRIAQGLTGIFVDLVFVLGHWGTGALEQCVQASFTRAKDPSRVVLKQRGTNTGSARDLGRFCPGCKSAM